MITTTAVITAKPGSGPTVEAALRELAAATHGEAGCLLYSLQRDLENPDRFVTVEKWESKADLDAHLTSPHVSAAFASAVDLLTEQPLIIATEPLDAGDEAKRTY